MTENHSEFSRESAVDPSGDVGQKPAVQNESVLSEIPPEKLTTCLDTDEVDLDDGDKKEICQTEAQSNGCEEESSPLQELWVKFSTFLKKFYRTILDGKKPPDELECHVNVVRELVTNDPHQLFARLEMDLQEFIIEVKLRQLELLNCVQTDEGPHLFIFCLLEGYNKLMFAAYSLSPLLLQLEVEHLTRFNITWRSLNQHLFHKLVFTEPKIQKVLPFCISKLGKNNTDLSDFNKRLIRQFLTFDDEMTKVGGRWREAESAIIKYHQENSMLDAKWRMTKINWELIRSQTKAFHEELKSSGISPCLDSDMVNGESPEDKDDFDALSENGRKTPPIRNTSMHIKTLTDSLKKMKIDLETLQDQQLCDCCHVSAAQCLSSPESFNLESLLDVKVPKNCSHSSCEVPNKEADLLAVWNPEGKKMYSHLHKYKAHQISNGGKTHTLIFNEETTSSQQDTQQSSNTPPETHKTLIRKQVIQQQRQQHQKKLMQMMQSSQQKDIQHKIQKQLQEHQLLLQQQRKIDELHAHLLQQRPTAKDAETQKNVHLQVQHRLMQKHKQVEEKFQQQVQQYMQQHQDKQSNASSPAPCSHTKRTVIGTKSTFKCSTTTNSGTTTNSAVTTTSSSSSSTTTTTTSNTTVLSGKTSPSSTNTKVANSTHKSSTTQTSVLTSTVNGEGWYLCPSSDGKSTSYVCPKHSDGSTYDLEISSDNSSDDEFDWENSNSPQRHCDCCYCEVFGSAPVSRNFQETRERLRLILTKKKAKSNAANNDKLNDQNIANDSSCSNAQSVSQGESKVKKDDGTGDGKAKPPEYKGDRPLQEILDFIEGNKRNTKRNAKKMRRKQRQQEEEERRRREEEEAERKRQEELRRQREEEKRRLEEERKKQELLRKQDRKKNKKQQQQQQQQSVVTKTPAPSAAQNGNCKKGGNKNQIVSDNAKLAQTKKNGQKVMDRTALQKQVVQQQQQAKSVNQTAKRKQEQAAQQAKLQQQQSKNSKGQKQTQSTVQGGNNAQKKVAQPSKIGQQGDEKTDDDSGQPQMVTIKRVMQPNSSEPTVTITLRGPTPKEDKVLYTLHNGQINPLKDDKQKQSNSSSTSTNVANKKKVAANKTNIEATANCASNLRSNPNISLRSVPATNVAHVAQPPPAPIVTLTNGMFSRTCSVPSNGVNSITDRMEKMKLGPQPVPIDPAIRKFAASAPPPPASQPELTTPTAIQINQAVSQLSSRPTFPNNFDLENIRLPPGITITKVDPATVQRKPIQVKQAPPPPPPPPPHLRQPMMSSMTPITSMTPMNCSPNVIVVDTGDKHDEQGGNGKKKRRRRKRENGEMGQDVGNFANGPAIPPYVPTNGLPPRLNPLGGGLFAGNRFVNTTGFASQQQPAAIIQMNGSMVTIRNPALHQSYAGGSPMNVNMPQASEMWNSNTNDTTFPSPPEEVENGDVDEYERELEAFKRFCSQSVPAESKAKVNLNIEDIVLKKKGPSVIGCS